LRNPQPEREENPQGKPQAKFGSELVGSGKVRPKLEARGNRDSSDPKFRCFQILGCSPAYSQAAHLLTSKSAESSNPNFPGQAFGRFAAKRFGSELPGMSEAWTRASDANGKFGSTLLQNSASSSSDRTCRDRADGSSCGNEKSQAWVRCSRAQFSHKVRLRTSAALGNLGSELTEGEGKQSRIRNLHC
jgi:hypothetical protein